MASMNIKTIILTVLFAGWTLQVNADPYLVSRLNNAERQCEKGQPGSCTEAREVRERLSSQGWCYGKPGDLPWERKKTGWVKCR